MSRFWRLLIVPALLVPLGTQTTHASSSLALITIRLTDLRPGYVIAEAQYRVASRIAAQGGSGAPVLLSHGWVDGYDALYRRRENPAVEVGQTIDHFRTAAGAHWWYGVSLVRVPAGYHSITLAPVGDESMAVRSQVFLGIIFRRGVYVADVYVSLRAPVPATSALLLARLLDRRLQAEEGVGPIVGQQNGAVTQPVPVMRGQSIARMAPLRTWVTPNPISSSAVAALYARTVPGAMCTDRIMYATGHGAHGFGGYVQMVGKSGLVFWSWRPGLGHYGGWAVVTCSAHGKTSRATTRFTVTG